MEITLTTRRQEGSDGWLAERWVALSTITGQGPQGGRGPQDNCFSMQIHIISRQQANS